MPIHRRTLPTAEDRARARLLSKIVVCGECWIWQGPFLKSGYGQFSFKELSFKGRVHRLAYILWNGPIPSGMNVLHECDNRACINPAHLTAGTQKQNLQQMSQRGRWRNQMGKLTYDDVDAILADTRRQRIIAAEYNISQQMVSNIKLGQRWRT